MMNRRNNFLTTVNPFREMDTFGRDFFMSPFFDSDFDMSNFGGVRTDITDEGDTYKLEADLPGFNKDDIHIDISDNTLKLSAERHSEGEDKDKKGKFIRKERSYGSYTRTFDLSDIKSDEIKAKYDNGVLTLTLPKKDEAVTANRRLEIE